MRRLLSRTGPALLGSAWLALLFGRLLSPERALANRDIPLFHLPLRASFKALVSLGRPVWNPWIHGGQPVLSNPGYGAFYPPSWIVLLTPPHYALNLLTLLHAALAFAGAWWLARRLGAGRGAAALAAVGFTGCGAWLSLLSAYTLFLSLAWLPWVLLAGDAALRAADGARSWLRPALLAGGAWAMQLLNGEPSTVVMSGLGLLCLALPVAVRRPAFALRLAVPFAAAVALAAVQLVPLAGRLADSPRAGGVPAEMATVWSLPPARAAEVVFPRVFGDPSRAQEGLFFGERVGDRGHPYVASLYPGLLLAVVGLAALLRGPVARRAAWAAAVAGGAFLALGRYNPLYGPIRELPPLSLLRFPEKFAALAVLALVFAGALGWQRLMEDRDAGRRERVDFPLALAATALAAALGLTLALYVEPRLGLWHVRPEGPLGVTPADQVRQLAYLRTEGWAAAATAAATAALLALCRWRRPSRRLLAALAVLLVAADLWHYGHRLVEDVPARLYTDPPPLARSLLPVHHRIFVQEAERKVFEIEGDVRTALARDLLARLDPYGGVLWGIPYALHQDYDLMLTGWGRRALAAFRAEVRNPERSFPYLGAWNVGALVLRKRPEDWLAERARDPRASPVRVVPNPHLMRYHRFSRRVTFHPSYEEALAAAREERFALARHEHAVRPGRKGGEGAAFSAPPQFVEPVRDEGGRVLLHYDAAEGGFFVVATTFDEGWRATLDGEPLPTYATAAAQIGILLPAGQHRVVLEYRDPRVATGAAVTLTALGLWLAGLALARRPRSPAGRLA